MNNEHVSQLFQYFAATEVRFGILTNGLIYRLYSDLDKPNQMDSRPFLELNMLEWDDGVIQELQRFAKWSFDLRDTIDAAIDLKYTKEIKRILDQQLKDPSEDFVRMFVSQIYSGKMTQRVREQFAPRVREAFSEFINDRVDRVADRAKSSMAAEGLAVSRERNYPTI